MKDFDRALQLFGDHQLTQSLEILNQIIKEMPAHVPALNLRGRIYYKMQRWGDAMNDYAAVLETEPENQEAKTGQEMAGSILGYFTPDMFNP